MKMMNHQCQEFSVLSNEANSILSFQVALPSKGNEHFQFGIYYAFYRCMFFVLINITSKQ